MKEQKQIEEGDTFYCDGALHIVKKADYPINYPNCTGLAYFYTEELPMIHGGNHIVFPGSSIQLVNKKTYDKCVTLIKQTKAAVDAILKAEGINI